MKKFFYFSTLMVCFLFFTSCHKDDIPELPDSDQATRDSIELVRKYKERDVLLTLCNIEDLPDGSCRYTPNYGKVLYSTTPTVRYVVVEDLKEAKLLFNAMLTMALDSTETVNMTSDDITYHIESRGSIHFSASSDIKTQIASVKVDFPVVPDLKEIVFIPKERWPYNAGSGLIRGAVYKDKESGYLFVSIANTESEDGVLITFDGEYTNEVKKGYSFTNWRSHANWGPAVAYTTVTDNYVKLQHKMSSYSDLLKLRKFMYTETYDKKSINPIAYKIFVEGIDNRRGLFPSIYNSTTKFVMYSGTEEWKGWWFGYYYYNDVTSWCINSSSDMSKTRYWKKEDWKILGEDRYIPSLSVTVDPSFDPVENGLKQIYPPEGNGLI